MKYSMVQKRWQEVIDIIIDSVKTYIKTCPLFKGDKINVNYLGENPVKYTIDNVPANPIVKRYCDGGTLRQFLFVIGSREAYDENAFENMKISKFYEDFATWIEEQDTRHNLPMFADLKLKATKIEVLTSGYLFDAKSTQARFQIQLKLTYRKEV